MEEQTKFKIIEGCKGIADYLEVGVRGLRMHIVNIERAQPNDQSLPQLQRLLEKLVQADTEARYTHQNLSERSAF